jgi:hypothetical protein
MFRTESHLPDITNAHGVRCTPRRAERLLNGLIRVDWKGSGTTTLYRPTHTDPRPYALAPLALLAAIERAATR